MHAAEHGYIRSAQTISSSIGKLITPGGSFNGRHIGFAVHSAHIPAGRTLGPDQVRSGTQLHQQIDKHGSPEWCKRMLRPKIIRLTFGPVHNGAIGHLQQIQSNIQGPHGMGECAAGNVIHAGGCGGPDGRKGNVAGGFRPQFSADQVNGSLEPGRVRGT